MDLKQSTEGLSMDKVVKVFGVSALIILCLEIGTLAWWTEKSINKCIEFNKDSVFVLDKNIRLYFFCVKPKTRG